MSALSASVGVVPATPTGCRVCSRSMPTGSFGGDVTNVDSRSDSEKEFGSENGKNQALFSSPCYDRSSAQTWRLRLSFSIFTWHMRSRRPSSPTLVRNGVASRPPTHGHFHDPCVRFACKPPHGSGTPTPTPSVLALGPAPQRRSSYALPPFRFFALSLSRSLAPSLPHFLVPNSVYPHASATPHTQRASPAYRGLFT